MDTEPSEHEKLVAKYPPPSPTPRTPVLLVAGGLSGVVAFFGFGAFFGQLDQFSGDWNGPISVQFGRGGGLGFDVAHAWTYFLPVGALTAAGAVACLACLIVLVVRDGKKAARP